MVATPYSYTKLFVVIALEVSECLVASPVYVPLLTIRNTTKAGVPSWCPKACCLRVARLATGPQIRILRSSGRRP